MSEDRPVRLIIGYLPGVSEKDALAYAQGFIMRHIGEADAAAYGAQRYGDGALYEIHVGGPRRALLPAIAKRVSAGETVYLRSSKRWIRIGQEGDAVEPLMLPEDAEVDAETELKPGRRLKPALGDAKHWIIAGSALFTIGVVVLLLGVVINQGVRYAYTVGFDSNPGVARLLQAAGLADASSPSSLGYRDYEELPVSQWNKMVAESSRAQRQGGYVDALRYEKGKWVIKTGGIPEPSAAPKPSKR